MKYGIICALDEESEKIIEAMTDKTEEKVSFFTFHKGKIGNNEVVTVSYAFGKVNAAVAAEIMILKYGADALINTGVAGGLKKGLMPGDTVLATKTVQHDVDTSPIGDPVGMVSREGVIFFPVDEELNGKIVESANELGFEIGRGIIATGDQFVATKEQRERIISLFGADVCEMEGGSVCQVAYMSDVKCAVLRAISDNGNGDAAVDYPTFTKSAAAKAAAILINMLKK